MIDAIDLQQHLPHRYPFLFIDRIESVDLDVPSIVAIKNVSSADPILQGHFPGNPILPGVVQIEAMAQAATVLGSLAGAFDQTKYNCLFLRIDEARFLSPALPGDCLRIEVEQLRKGRIGIFRGVIKCGDEVRSEAKITAGFFPKKKP